MASKKKSTAQPPEAPQLELGAAPSQEPSALPAKRRKLLAVEIRNFMGVEFCRIDFKRALTLIGGANESGKSSTLKGIKSVLSGRDALPTDPIRDGAPSARLWADLGDLTVERLIDPKLPEGTTLSMLDESLNPVPKPVTELARMYNALSFDPMAFAELGREKQDVILKRLAELDFTKVDATRKEAYEARTGVNRDIRDLEAKFRAAKHHEDAPAKEVSVEELTKKLAEHDAWDSEHLLVANAKRDADRAVELAQERVDRARRALALAQQELERTEEDLGRITSAASADIKAFNEFKPAPTPPRAAVLESIRDSGEKNRLLRENEARRQLGTELQAKKAREAELTRTIEQCDASKAEAIAAAKFPIEGLGFDEYGPTYKGHPIDQAADSARWRIGAAIALALNPSLPLLLIRSGSDFDDNTLAQMHDWAEERGAQLVIEVVRPSGEGCDVVMKNGVGEQKERTTL